MDKATKTIVGIVVAVVIIGGIYALAKNNKKTSQTYGGATQTAAATYKVGVILPLTGDAASYGEPGRNVYQMAVDEVNSSGGVDGKNLELVVEDGKCNGKDASNAMEKLVNVDKVQFVMGGFCSSESLAAAPIATTAKVPLVSPASTSPALTGVSPFFDRIIPSDASQGSLDAQVAYDKGWRKVAFIQEQTDYALGIYKAFSEKFQSLGGTVMKEEFPTGTSDFRTQLTKLRGQNPDALFLDGQASASTQRILKQLTDMSWKPHFLINEATAGDAQTIADNKTLLEGAIGAEFRTDLANAKFQHLLDAYKKKYGADLPYQSYAQNEYDEVFMVRDGIKAVGYDGQKLADWLRSVKDWDGASGKITIKSDGDRESGYSSEMVQDGKMVALK
jgi:branched-chain amino acid transport system substrate-binding protein